MAREVLLAGLVAAFLHDLMDTLTSHAEALGYPLKSPAVFPELGDGCVLSPIDLGVRMGMLEQELTPVVPASDIQSLADAGVGHEEEIVLSRQARNDWE
jgi:hypothetical protein